MVEKIDIYTPIPESECDVLWREIVEKHNMNLTAFSVSLPSDGSNKKYQLIYLYKYMGCCVHKDVVSQFVADHVESAARDQQVRHLAGDGFCVLNRGESIVNTGGDVVPSGYNMLTTLDYPKPAFMRAYLKRVALLNPSDFEALKQVYAYRCASCGAKESEPHKVTGRPVQLQQGHMDPRKPLGPGNTIPQCQYCNQIIYKDFFVFDENGYPNRVSNPDYVMRSDKEIRRAIFELIKRKDNLR